MSGLFVCLGGGDVLADDSIYGVYVHSQSFLLRAVIGSLVYSF
jgi:hypothetical protein